MTSKATTLGAFAWAALALVATLPGRAHAQNGSLPDDLVKQVLANIPASMLYFDEDYDRPGYVSNYDGSYGKVVTMRDFPMREILQVFRQSQSGWGFADDRGTRAERGYLLMSRDVEIKCLIYGLDIRLIVQSSDPKYKLLPESIRPLNSYKWNKEKSSAEFSEQDKLYGDTSLNNSRWNIDVWSLTNAKMVHIIRGGECASYIREFSMPPPDQRK
jgi:hypothetical protein